ncbi:vacuolar protein sorting-associated protein 13B isoform X1 [Lates japonicus]|uniref:Vacuolar protein sorting-associated protein 13B isoform X1 n=1 Tax=Lates japonicus TaxID=270547 RepID=A0AAD3M7J7_LATJO|nr:vacuolar protein sorting-associated protein 13B isoform X1 [Lates japonicus]
MLVLGVKSLGPSPTLEGSVQNLELKFCSRATVKCASGTVGAVKVCARTPGSGEGVKEKLVPLIQGPSDTKELHMSRWLNEIRKPESLLAPDLLVFSVLVPQQEDNCRNSGHEYQYVITNLSSPPATATSSPNGQPYWAPR